MKFVSIGLGGFLLLVAGYVCIVGWEDYKVSGTITPISSFNATAVLLPDYVWHTAYSGTVHVYRDRFCFIEDLGEHYINTCGPKDSLLGWRYK